MLNPWVLLVVGIVWVATFALGYVKGSTHAENKAKAQYSEQLAATIAQARATAIEDMQIEVEAESKRQKARIEFRDKIVTVERIIHAKPSPAECRIPDAAVGLLRDAINAANGVEKPAELRPVPPAPAIKQRPTGHVDVGLRGHN